MHNFLKHHPPFFLHSRPFTHRSVCVGYFSSRKKYVCSYYVLCVSKFWGSRVISRFLLKYLPSACSLVVSDDDASAAAAATVYFTPKGNMLKEGEQKEGKEGRKEGALFPGKAVIEGVAPNLFCDLVFWKWNTPSYIFIARSGILCILHIFAQSPTILRSS